MKKKTHKHSAYYNLLDAVRAAHHCPLCEMESAATTHYLDNLLEENVNDSGTRDELRNARGFCPRHAHLLLARSESLGTAIIYQEQLRLFLDYLDAAEKPPGVISRTRATTHPVTRHCPACRSAIATRARYLETMRDGLGEPELRQALDESPGLCAPHLEALLKRVHDLNSRAYLLELHRSRYSALLTEISEYIRRNDYRFTAEGFGKESNSWIRAVNMLVGLKDVF